MTAPIGPDAAGEALVDQIYATLRAPEGWNALVSDIGAWLGADSGMMMTPALPGTAPVMLFVYGLALTALMTAYPKYAGRAVFTNRAMATGCTPGAFLLDDLIPPEEQADSEYWRDMVAPHEVTSGIFGMIRTPDEGTPVILNYYRKTARAPYTQADIARFETLFPHLRRVLALTLDAPAPTALPSETKDIYDSIAAASFLLDGDGAVAHRNAAAQALLGEQDGLTLAANKILLADKSAQERLEEAVHRILDAPWSGRFRMGAEILARRPRSGKALIVIVTPIASATPLIAIRSPVRCAVMILEERLRTSDAARERLRRLYGLTDAEIEVASGLASGSTPPEIAKQRGSSLATVRVQIKRVLAKTGARRQGELIGLISRLSG